MTFFAINRRERWQGLAVLSSPVFVVSLAILICNDWLLKPWLHDWLTGKLSDFSGLFVFASLVLIVFPRHASRALVGVAIAFAWWKSPFSQPFIDLIQRLSPVDLHRTVDYTDLMALLVLPAVGSNFRRWSGARANQLLVYPLGTVALLAVMATSALPVIEGGDVQFPASDAGDTQYVTALYQTIDSFAASHALVLDPSSVDQFHRSYASSAYSLQVNYDADSKTLYYGFGPVRNGFPLGGISVDPSVRKMEADFLQTLSSRFPDVKSEAEKQYSAWGGGPLSGEGGQLSQIGVYFSDVHTDRQGCVQPDDSNPDMQRALQIADAFATEQGLRAREPIWKPAGCAGLLTRAYVSASIVGPGLDSSGLKLTVEPGVDELDALFFMIGRRDDEVGNSADLAVQLYDRLKAEHWKSDKVRVGTVTEF